MPKNRTEKPFEAGTNWMPERNKLYRFTDHGVVVIRPWPLPQAWRKHGSQNWHPSTPRIDLQIAVEPEQDLSSHKRKGTAAEQYAWSTIPQPVREAVLKAHFAGYQWPSLSMMARCPGAIELTHSTPMLAAMLAVGNRIREQPVGWLLRSIRSLLKPPDGWQRWLKICRWLGLEESRSFVRMVRKVDVHEFGWTLHHWKLILYAWQQPKGKNLLRHVPKIVEAHGELFDVAFRHLGARRGAEIIQPSLMAEVSEAGLWSGANILLDSSLSLWRRICPHRQIPKLQSIETIENWRSDIIEIAEELEQQVHRQQLLARLNMDAEDLDELTERLNHFPPPPLAGIPKKIISLSSPEALKREGEDMHHCLGNGSWLRLSKARMGYAYSINLNGIRATVWLARDERKSPGFRVEQIRGPSNQPPPPEVIDLIFRWLDEHSAWQRHRGLDHMKPTLTLLSEEPHEIPDEWDMPPHISVLNQLSYNQHLDLGDDIPF
ncbi:MAG: hypothetical protein CL930_10050 [Deltaproteobacteria bacterium]|nr:hypothetical protein [Deltaproteobacteria bacterium]